ncbi:MAG: hypothetical protein WC564_02730 [Patescibacteria group bacterium]|jgi:hypothetical protein
MIKKIIKTYFITFHKYPALSFLLPALIAIVLILILPPQYGNNLLMTAMMAAIVHLVVVAVVAERHITASRLVGDTFDQGKKWFSVLVTKEKDKIILDHYVWATGQVFDIQKPESFLPSLESLVIIPVEITGKFRDTNLKFYGKLRLGLREGFDKVEVFDKLLEAQPGRKVLCLQKYLTDTFNKNNIKCQDEINEAISQHFANGSSENSLADTITGILSFPKKIFSNVILTEIIMEGVSFSFRSEK